jgi:hypothetical protein
LDLASGEILSIWSQPWPNNLKWYSILVLYHFIQFGRLLGDDSQRGERQASQQGLYPCPTTSPYSHTDGEPQEPLLLIKMQNHYLHLA